MILIDYNHLVIEAASGSLARLRKIDRKLLKHIFYTRLAKFVGQNKATYGMPVICHEGRHIWRREHYEYYKANRSKESRDASGLDWDTIFEIGEELSNEMQTYLKYPVLKRKGYEADDNIAAVVRMFPNEKHLIVARDSDFIQLQWFGNVDQLDVIGKKLVKLDEDQTLDEYFFINLIKGQRKDGIPSVFSKDEALVEKIRQSPVSKQMLEALVTKFSIGCKMEDVADFILGSEKFTKILEKNDLTGNREELLRRLNRNLLVGSLLDPVRDHDDWVKKHLEETDTEWVFDEAFGYLTREGLGEISGKLNDILVGKPKPVFELF